jgi:putative pyruvate formate lyase activating enzyme
LPGILAQALTKKKPQLLAMPAYLPRYYLAYRDSRLRAKAAQAAAQLTSCTLCPRRCRVDRTSGETGYCGTAARAVVASYHAHFGEEAPLVGQNGSGTIFFSNCNLLCNFCQNFDISHGGEGSELSDSELAQIMLSLQAAGCHNINFVTPSHVVPQILSALVLAAEKGLEIPLVYNSGGYDSVETLKILDGVIDIYMPDFKFWDASVARQTCQAPDYPEVAQNAVAEMHRQVGELALDARGIATSGLLIRHLVLPCDLAGTGRVMAFIAEKISKNTYVNIMNQYRPCGRAPEIESMARSVTAEEYAQAVAQARKVGLTRLDRPRRVFMLY